MARLSSHIPNLLSSTSPIQLFLLVISLSLSLITALPQPTHSNPLSATTDYAVSCRAHTSFYCPWTWGPSFLYLDDIQSTLGTLHPNVRYPKGLPYACLEYWGDGAGYCVFTEGDGVPDNGLTVGEVREKVEDMRKAGCWACGIVGWDVDVPIDDEVVVVGQEGVGGGRKSKRAFVKIDWVGKPDRCARDEGSGYVCEIVVIKGAEKVDTMRI